MISLIYTHFVRSNSIVIKPRRFSICRRSLARSTIPDDNFLAQLDLSQTKAETKAKDKPPTKKAIEKALDNQYAYLTLQAIDQEHGILNESTTKVVDIGCVPGNWMKYTIQRLCELHGVEREKLYKKCYILGVDLMFQPPPLGVSTIQGNIFSKFTHKTVINQLKAYAQHVKQEKESENQEEDEIEPKSYITKEQEEQELEHEIAELDNKMNGLSLDANNDYRVDVVLSDLARPFTQLSGHYNHSMKIPYFRSNKNKSLSQMTINPGGAGIDLAEAALLLTCSTLKPGGTFVVRLETVKKNDPELGILGKRLEMVFNEVQLVITGKQRGLSNNKEHDLYYICRDKRKDAEYDIRTIFNLQ
ncbi:rRNA methyltransferase 2 mitochondrial [Spathaspora sp. JA1]|nr:rRNA methyltransferase 2 mitochondrial [Spathaspora sp. JA1]